MNAYELADVLDNIYLENGVEQALVEQAADMLREQAIVIEIFEAVNEKDELCQKN